MAGRPDANMPDGIRRSENTTISWYDLGRRFVTTYTPVEGRLLFGSSGGHRAGDGLGNSAERAFNPATQYWLASRAAFRTGHDTVVYGIDFVIQRNVARGGAWDQTNMFWSTPNEFGGTAVTSHMRPIVELNSGVQIERGQSGRAHRIMK